MREIPRGAPAEAHGSPRERLGGGRFGAFSCAVVLVSVLAGLVWGEDAVYLRRGGVLRGTVTATTSRIVVLELASGEIRLPRGQVARIERDVPGEGLGVRRIRRDEWSFLLRDDRVAGWSRVLHWEQGDRVQVEERRVLFASRSERRRVEIVGPNGTPVEYLWVESSPGRMELWSGQITRGEHVRQHRSGGAIETSRDEWTKGATLPLVAWSKRRLRAGPSRVRIYDPRRGRVQELTLSEAPVADWSGETLPTTAARVALAQRVHAPADPKSVAENALLHPLTPRPLHRRVVHLAGGFSLIAPNERWVDQSWARADGKLLVLENRITFARVEVEVVALRDPSISVAEALRRARMKLALAYDWAGPIGAPNTRGDGMRQRLELRRGKERWQAILQVQKRGARAVVVMGLAPLRVWSLERGNLGGILGSMVVVD